MAIPRKPNKETTATIDTFIKKAPTQNLPKVNDQKKGRRIISLSLMFSDAEWIDQTLDQINSTTMRKITRSEIISTAISALQEKPFEEIVQVIKNR